MVAWIQCYRTLWTKVLSDTLASLCQWACRSLFTYWYSSNGSCATIEFKGLTQSKPRMWRRMTDEPSTRVNCYQIAHLWLDSKRDPQGHTRWSQDWIMMWRPAKRITQNLTRLAYGTDTSGQISHRRQHSIKRGTIGPWNMFHNQSQNRQTGMAVTI